MLYLRCRACGEVFELLPITPVAQQELLDTAYLHSKQEPCLEQEAGFDIVTEDEAF